MQINELDGNTILMVSAKELKDFAQELVNEAAAKLTCREEPAYTPKEFAARHRVAVSTLWRWCQQGILSPTKIGKKVYYRDSDLLAKEA